MRKKAGKICPSCGKVLTPDGRWEKGSGTAPPGTGNLCPECRTRTDAEAKDTAEDAREPEDGDVRDLDLADPVIRRIVPLLDDRMYENNPLAEELRFLLWKYARLMRRLRRMSKIGTEYEHELHELSDAFNHASRTDPVTGIPNRKEMLERLKAEKSRTRRHGGSYAIILADIDHFRALNEAHGREAVDDILASFAAAMRHCLRKEDACARWGADEFIIMLPEAELRDAMVVADKIRGLITEIRLEGRETHEVVTASFGVIVSGEGEDVEDCLRRVSTALESARKLGGDISISSEGPA